MENAAAQSQKNNPSSVKVTERKSYFSRYQEQAGKKEGKKSSGNFQVILERKKKIIKKRYIPPPPPHPPWCHFKHAFLLHNCNKWLVIYLGKYFPPHCTEECWYLLPAFFSGDNVDSSFRVDGTGKKMHLSLMKSCARTQSIRSSTEYPSSIAKQFPFLKTFIFTVAHSIKYDWNPTRP